MICGKTLLDQVSNSVLREWTNVENIERHLRAHCLRWLEHLKRINVESLTIRVYEDIKEGNTRRGRPKKTWEEMVKHDMRKRNLTIEDAND